MAKKNTAPVGPFGNFQRQPTTRERLAATIEATKEARAKIEAQAPQREAQRKLEEKIAKRHKPGTTAFYRAVAEAQRAARDLA